ncbi:MAG: hypothetical protein ACREQY_12840 [Candidatus Binatia bacterium]
MSLVALSGVIVASACSSGSAEISQRTDPATLRVPSQLVGLSVQQEDVAKELKRVEKPYVDSVAIFSLREDKLLQATLQVSRFNSLARPGDADFRGSIIATVGSTRPRALTVSDRTVYATSAASQDVFVWFTRNGMFVLSISNDFPFPRTLLRRTLDLELA